MNNTSKNQSKESEDVSNQNLKDIFAGITFPETIINKETNTSENEINELQKFKDFLTLPKISGKGTSLSDTNFISSENIINRDEYVEIADVQSFSSKTTANSTIMLIKDEKGEIKQIEVICKCGNISHIQIEYEE